MKAAADPPSPGVGSHIPIMDNFYKALLRFIAMALLVTAMFGLSCSKEDPVNAPPVQRDWVQIGPPGTTTFRSVSGASGNNVFVVGISSGIWHFDGSIWEHLDAVGYGSLRGVWVDSQSGYVFAVGYGNLRASFNDFSCDTLQSSACWEVDRCESCPEDYEMECVWGLRGNRVYAVGHFTDTWGGSSGAAEWYFDGEWYDRRPESEEILYGVWGSDQDNIWAVGGNAVILRNWDQYTHSMATDAAFFSIWGDTWRNIYVVGQGGTVAHFDGNDWALVEIGVKEDLRGVWGSSADDVYAVGENGTIVHFDGGDWSKMDSGTSFDLYSVWGASKTAVFAVGEQNTVLRLK